MARKYFCNLFRILLAFVIGVAVCLTAMPTLHSHAEEAVSDIPAITVSSQTVTAGDYAYVTVTAENFVDLAALEFSLYYDETVMTQSWCGEGWFLTENGAIVTTNEETPGEIRFNAMNADAGIQGSGTLLEIGFYISPGAEAGFYPITLAVGSVYDLALTPITVEKHTGVITIQDSVSSTASVSFYAYVSDYTVSKGDTFTYTLCGEETAGLAGGNFNFTYDSNLLELVDVSVGSELLSSTAIYSVNNTNPGYVKVSYGDIEAINTYNGAEFFELTFKVIADVSESTSIGFSTNSLISENLEEMTSYGNSCHITVQSLQDADPALKMVANDDLTADGIFTVDVNLSAYSDIAAGDFTITYETWQVKCTNVEKKVPSNSGAYVEWKEDIGNGSISFSYLKMEPFIEEQTILTLTFQTQNNASGNIYMYASGSNVVDSNVNPLYVQYPAFDYVIPMNIGNYWFWLNETSFSYDGTAKTPTVYADMLVEGTDYTVSYENNTDTGTAYAVVTGKGNYGGKQELAFTIHPAVLTVTADNKSKLYGADNPAYTATITGFVGSDTQSSVLGTAVPTMTCSATKQSSAGSYAIKASGLPALQNYTYVYVDGTLTIDARDLNSAGITVAEITKQAYTGMAIKPDVVVTDGTVTLKEGTDYTVSYDNNISAGTATATITGKGNYTGQKTVTFTIVALFTDLEPGYYYITPVMWAVENGITTGTSTTTFSPNGPCTRGQVVTFLHRAAGKPAATITTHSFTDLQAGWFYIDAVMWAVENGVTTGTSATTFSPDATCTRGQVVTFLWRAMGSPKPTTTNNPFTDLQPGYYYNDAVLWAVENGITTGTSATTFSPDAPCTRGQVVTFLYRTYN